MVEAGKSDIGVQNRVDFFQHRVPEEFYDLEHDPDALHNLIDNPEYSALIAEFRKVLKGFMEKYQDPLLAEYHTEAYDLRINECRKLFLERLRTVGNESMNYRNVVNPWKNDRSDGKSN